MKRIINILLVLLISLNLVSCFKKDSVIPVLEAELKRLKDEAISSLIDETMEDNKPYSKKLDELVSSFDYEISNEVINNDKATVDVEIKTYEIGDALKNNYKSYFDSLAKGDISFDKEVDEFLDENMLNELLAIEEKGKTYNKKITFPLTKVDNAWTLDENIEDNYDFSDAILGGMITTINELPTFIEEYYSTISPEVKGNLVSRYEATRIYDEELNETVGIEELEQLKAQGVEVSIEFYDDNTGILRLFSDEIVFNYNDQEIMVVGLKIPYVLNEGYLSFKLQNTTFDFGLAE